MLMLALACFATGWLGLQIPYVGPHIVLLWMPTGVAVAALFRWGNGVWPGVYLGAFMINIFTGDPWLVAAGISVGNTLGPLLSVWWLKRAEFRPAFQRVRDVGSLALAAGMGMTVSSSCGIAGLYLGGLTPIEAAGFSWLTWWMGDTVGVLLVTPLLLNLSAKNIRQLLRNRGELLLWITLAIPVVWISFIRDYTYTGRALPMRFLGLPLLAWAAMRFGIVGATLAALGLSTVAAWSLGAGHGYFQASDPYIGLLLSWTYISITALSGLLITAFQSERVELELSLREGDEKLRALYDLSPLGIALGTVDGRFIEFNEAFRKICGHTDEELKGIDYRKLTPQKYEAEDARQLEILRQDGKYGPYEKEYIRSDGSLIPLRLNGVLLNGRDGRQYIWSIVEDITDRKAADEEIRQLAFFDPLTRLPNRRLLLDRLHLTLATSHRVRKLCALLYIDLDHFKTLNDTLGHEKGDSLLQQVAHRLTSSVREGDTVARLGGDEFVVMLEDVSQKIDEAATQAEIVGEKILAELGRPYLIAGHEHHSTASIGITLFGNRQETLEELLKQADLAMYQAKGAGRNTLRFFDPRMQAAVNARLALDTDLRKAMQREQFVLYYQGQIDGAGYLAGAEILLRWQHPTRGMVPPGEFIPLAEETGLILPLGQWVLDRACAQLAAWATRPDTAHLTLAVNVSVQQLREADFVEQVLAALARSGANSQRLKLEMTESLLMDNMEDTIAKMTELRAAGVGFALDDFGTGYSSLSYLKLLPLERLKIDRSFVMDVLTDPNDAAIAKTIVALAQSLGLAVIAEGVETEEQREFLAQNGCPAYQGYLFSPPLPLEGFEALMQQARMSPVIVRSYASD